MLGAGALKHYYIDGLPNDHWFLTLRTGKKNPLNVYFIKLGWLWTWITLIPFCLLTRFVYSWRQSDNPNTTTNKTSNFWFDLLSNCFYSSFRMAICTGIWYATTQSFVLYENKYGTCILNPGSNTSKSIKSVLNFTKLRHLFDMLQLRSTQLVMSVVMMDIIGTRSRSRAIYF